MTDLNVQRIATWVPACDSGQHIHHPGLTCEQADAQIVADEAAWKRHLRTPMADVPAALRGPNWPGPAARDR